jgi:predicted ATPase
MGQALQKLTIEGFKSIRKLEDFELRPLNVLIGANGAGKSNFIGFFRLLRELIEQHLRVAVETAGGADALLHLGPKVTKEISARFQFGNNGYEFTLIPTNDNRLIFSREQTLYHHASENTFPKMLGAGHTEAKLKDRKDEGGSMGAKFGPPHYVFEALSSWVVYHFHDTSNTAMVRRWGPVNDNERLQPDAGNLAAFLFRLQSTHPQVYSKIRDVVRLAVPFFEDFKLRPIPQSPEMIQLEWTQMGSDYFLRPSQLSDGTLRFMCLATALLQPSLPSTALFDEPELGLHPYALILLASLFQQAAAKSRQIIVSTQSAALLDEFAPADVVVVERVQGQSTFRRLQAAALDEWLKEYALGELWQKNVLGGRPRSENATSPPEQAASDLPVLPLTEVGSAPRGVEQ